MILPDILFKAKVQHRVNSFDIKTIRYYGKSCY